MTWHSFYLGAFLLGFVLSVVTVLAGFIHLPFGHGLHLLHGLRLPHGFHGGAGHAIGHVGGGAHAGAAATPSGHAPSAGHGHGDGISPLNFASAMAFLAWFGGAGYLATSRAHTFWLVGLAIATAAGFVGAAIVFGFLARIAARQEATLDPADFEMVGTLARVIVPIREGGTGEISFTHQRIRRCSGARRDGPGTLKKGAEVFVTRYEKGIAYVRPFETDEI